MGANYSAEHFQYNDSWDPREFVAASKSWYRQNQSEYGLIRILPYLHCTTNTSRDLCIASIFNGIPATYVDIARGNHKSYARRHNYTYCSTRRAPVDRAPTWAKLLVLAALQRRCRAILWVDADAIFTSPLSMAPHLVLLKRYHMLFSGQIPSCARSSVAVAETMWGSARTSARTNPLGPTNAGAFFIRSSPFTEEALHTLYGHPFGIASNQRSHEHKANPIGDNGAVNDWLRVVANMQYFRDRVAFVNSDAFNCHPHYYHPGCRVLHVPGVTLLGAAPTPRKGGSIKYVRLGQLLKASCFSTDAGTGSIGEWRHTRCGQMMCQWSLYGCPKMPQCVNSF